MQETCDIEDADDDEGHDDVRKKTRRANLETIACAIDKEIKDILFSKFQALPFALPPVVSFR